MTNFQKQLSDNNIDILGLRINNTTLENAAEHVVNAGAPTNKPHTYYFVNAHSINSCCKHSGLSDVLRRADRLFADGLGMRIAAKRSGTELIDNVNGTDLLPVLCQKAAVAGKRLFLFGAKPGIADKAAKNLQKQFKHLQIAGTHHGFVGPDDMPALINKINQSKADIVMVAMGTPLQECWVDRYAAQLQCQAVMAVGGLFDFFSGSIPRAPLFMRKHGMEWLFRLMQEPMTKFERYVLGIPEFLYHVFVQNKRFTGER